MLNELQPVCLNALFSILKNKVTVGKDTQNIKRAVCCSEVGPIDETARCKQGHHPNDFVTSEAFVPSNASFVGLTGIWISFVVCRPTSNSRSL